MIITNSDFQALLMMHRVEIHLQKIL